MATRKGKKGGAKAATKAPVKETKKAKAAPKKESEGRAVAAALLDRKSPEFKALTERYQGWVIKWQDNGVAQAMKNVHRILGHNKGLFIISTTTGMFQVGTMSASGKSFQVAFETEDADEAWENYRGEREGNYGKDKAPAKTPAKGKKAAKKAPAKKSAKGKGRKASAPQEDDDIDELLD